MGRMSVTPISGLAVVIAVAFACSDGPTNPGELGTIEELVEFERPADDECGGELEALYNGTDAATSLSMRDERGLLNKVAMAARKINQGKFQDAVDKLADYDQKLSELEATIDTDKEKISKDDANALRALLTAAQTCAEELVPEPLVSLPPDVNECEAELEALYDATAAATSLKARDRTGLQNKVANAAQKINEGKFQDAADKLDDYDQKLTQLEATIGTGKEKISQTDADVLRPLLENARACVTNLLSGP